MKKIILIMMLALLSACSTEEPVYDSCFNDSTSYTTNGFIGTWNEDGNLLDHRNYAVENGTIAWNENSFQFSRCARAVFDNEDKYFNTMQNFSISLWTNATDLGRELNIIARYNRSHNGYGTWYLEFDTLRDDWKLIEFNYFCGVHDDVSTMDMHFNIPEFFDNNYHHLAIVVEHQDNTTYGNIYMDSNHLNSDSRLNRSSTNCNGTISNELTMQLGSFENGLVDRRYPGQIKDLVVFNYSLTQEEVRGLYETEN